MEKNLNEAQMSSERRSTLLNFPGKSAGILFTNILTNSETEERERVSIHRHYSSFN